MNYKIGLDVGITSVGWAVLELNEKEEPCRIVEMGSRIFNAAEQPKTGASLALPRRMARSSRRRLRRHRHRLERIRWLIENEKILTKEVLQNLYDGVTSDVYELRVKALDNPITPEEFARLLIHWAQRRGFQSNRKSDTADKDAGKLLTAVSQNHEIMASKGYRTVGEMLLCDEKFKEKKRNKADDYALTVSRAMVKEEVKTVFLAQRSFGMPFAATQIEGKYLDILLSQRSFEEGPGGDSPYGGDQIEKMRGLCVFEGMNGEKRAAKASYSAEYCNLLQNINHIKLVGNGAAFSLNADQRRAIIEAAHKTEALTFAGLRKVLQMPDEIRFNRLTYGAKSVEDVEKAKFQYLKAYHKIRLALDKLQKGRIKYLSRQQLNAVGLAFTIHKNDDAIRGKLQAAQLEPNDIDALIEGVTNFSGFGRLSEKACEKLIIHLEQGMIYNEACAAAGYDFKAHQKKYSFLLPADAPEFENITNPVARRAVAQTIKVVNAIIRKQGISPSFVTIELAREMAKDFSERKQIEKQHAENRAANERAMDRIRSEYNKIDATGQDLIKLKLWEEQGGICPYSLKTLSIEKLFHPGYADVDHIVPYSLCFDDSFRNKVLVHSDENRQKGNRLPLQYLSGEKADRFKVWVNAAVHDFRKKQKLLKEKFAEEEQKEFKERNLTDTKYISSLLYNFINDNLEFAPTKTGRIKRVQTVNGAITSYMRKRWGITKLREDGDLHHAVDAVVVACVTDGMIKRITDYCRYHEMAYIHDDDGAAYAVDRKTGEVLERFPYPWQFFRKELEARLSNEPAALLAKLKLPNYSLMMAADVKPCFVSRMPRRKVQGPAHKETVKSPREQQNDALLSKQPLTALKLDKNDEIENYYNPSSDTLLYNALKQRLQAHGGDGKKAFSAFKAENPFRKPTADGKPGNPVRKVKLYEKSTLNVMVHDGKGAADNGSMVRIDIFYVESQGYYFVPIYVSDTLKSSLPNKAALAFKSYENWPEMREQDFLFSLYPNDCLRVTGKSPFTLTNLNKLNSTLPEKMQKNPLYCYFVSAGIAVATISVINHDNTYGISSLGIKTLLNMEKIQVGVLGEISVVGKEIRQTFR